MPKFCFSGGGEECSRCFKNHGPNTPCVLGKMLIRRQPVWPVRPRLYRTSHCRRCGMYTTDMHCGCNNDACTVNRADDQHTPICHECTQVYLNRIAVHRMAHGAVGNIMRGASRQYTGRLVLKRKLTKKNDLRDYPGLRKDMVKYLFNKKKRKSKRKKSKRKSKRRKKRKSKRRKKSKRKKKK